MLPVEVRPILANGPAATSGLADEGVVRLFVAIASAGSKLNRAEPGTFHGGVEIVVATLAQPGGCGDGGSGVIGLHEDVAHPEGAVIGFEEDRLRAVEPGEDRG